MTLAELFADTHRLRIPDYQRAYAWTTVEAGQLLDDIVLALDEAQGPDRDKADDYFLGAVVLMEIDDQPSGATHEIVDGLQRIVTLTILFAVARDLIADADPATAALADRAISGPALDGKARQRKVELAGEEQAFLAAFVQEPGASAAMPEDDALTEAESRMLEVREHLMAMLVDESNARIADIVRFLLGHCHCAVISTRTIDRAHRIFSVLNDRGRPLARGDILKAQILGHIPIAERTSYRDLWSGLERRLGGSLEDLLSHIRTIEGRTRSRIIDDIRALVARSGNASAFLDNVLLPYGAILEAIHGGGRGAGVPSAGVTPPAEAIARHLTYLGWLGSADWIAPLMLWWRLAGGAPERVSPFLARLDRLAYCMRFLGLGADKRTIRYQAVIDAIRAGTVERAGGPLDVTRDEQRLILYNLRNIHTRSQLACKLLLLRINDELAGKPEQLDPTRLTVEHVLPQKPPRNSQWREWFAATDERERCTQSLGNLILVTRDKNERARNLELARKLEVYFADPDEQPLITRDIQGATRWLPEDVRRREERLVAAVTRLWQIGPVRPGPGPEDEAAGESPRRHKKSAQRAKVS